MADTEMQKAQAASQAGAELQEKGKDVSKLLVSMQFAVSCPTQII